MQRCNRCRCLPPVLAWRPSSPYNGTTRNFLQRIETVRHLRITRQYTTSDVRSSNDSDVRVYEYDVDVHGQLFLSDTKIRNFTSCFKDPAFLSFFYSRVKRNDSSDELARSMRQRGYEYVSLCGKEVNYIRPADTVVVYQSLTSSNDLTYAGTSLNVQFDPTALRADARGYLYHPSPPRTLRTRTRSRRLSTDSTPPPLPSSPTEVTTSQSNDTERAEESRYGPYSLMRSSLVLDTIAKTLDWRDDAKVNDMAAAAAAAAAYPSDTVVGTVEWDGKTYDIRRLADGQVWRRNGWDGREGFQTTEFGDQI